MTDARRTSLDEARRALDVEIRLRADELAALERAASAAARADRRALDVEIKLRRIELAALERATDILAAAAEPGCDRAGRNAAAPCAGPIAAAWCRACGHVVRRCEFHGGGRAVAQALHHHGRAKHGGTFAAPTDDQVAVLGGGAAVPVGRLSSPPAARGDGDGWTADERADDGETHSARADSDVGGVPRVGR